MRRIVDIVTIIVCLLTIVGITLFFFTSYKETEKVKEDRVIQLKQAYNKRGIKDGEYTREGKNKRTGRGNRE